MLSNTIKICEIKTIDRILNFFTPIETYLKLINQYGNNKS